METGRPAASVAYVYSGPYTRLCSSVERCKSRTAMVHSLVHAYGLFDRMNIVAGRRATEAELRLFHSEDYVRFCVERLQDGRYTETEAAEFGFDGDCPPGPSVGDYVRLVAGASIDCARAVSARLCRIAVHWAGGWHHATESSAAGFCYVNDCALAILTLREHFDTVMYVDIDAHHGDGVQYAFYSTHRVPCLSFHQYETGFYPGTGGSDECGIGSGHGYNINFPVKPGLSDEQFLPIFDRLFAKCVSAWRPSAVVLQCGCDALAGDKLAHLALSIEAYVHVARAVAATRLPTVVLGGGGYHRANAARCWARVTHALVAATAASSADGGVAVPPLPDDIPEHDYFAQYGPDFTLRLDATARRDTNNAADLSIVCADFEEMLDSVAEERQSS